MIEKNISLYSALATFNTLFFFLDTFAVFSGFAEVSKLKDR